MAVITVENLTKRFHVAQKQPGLLSTVRHFFRREYRVVEAVRNIDFSIEQGEIVGFLGPNGAGKTTTLKMLTGLIHPSGGRVQVVGHDPFRRRPEFLEQITLVMGQKQQLIWDLPAMDSLRINAAVYRISRKDFDDHVGELAEMLHLQDKLTQPVRKLSLGERMKAELLAALLHKPRVLFLDEPTLGLDINAQAAVRDFLRQYNRRYNATVLLTSHYMADITALCKRVMLIHEGELMHDGPLATLMERLAPHRQVTIETNEPIDPTVLEQYGRVESVEGTAATLLLQRDRLTRQLDRLLNELDVVDLTVTDPPIERLIGQLFTAGRIEQDAAARAAG